MLSAGTAFVAVSPRAASCHVTPCVSVAVAAQFLDCVWQLMMQHPKLFEFTPRLLLIVADHLYSCRFGTFLFNNEKEQRHNNVVGLTESLWGYLGALRHKLRNPIYDATVRCCCEPLSCVVWSVSHLCPITLLCGVHARSAFTGHLSPRATTCKLVVFVSARVRSATRSCPTFRRRCAT